jgi:hypothetical protein
MAVQVAGQGGIANGADTAIAQLSGLTSANLQIG